MTQITNVLELQKMLYPQKDPEKQLVFYRVRYYHRVQLSFFRSISNISPSQEGLGTSGTNFPGTDYELPLSSKVSQVRHFLQTYLTLEILFC